MTESHERQFTGWFIPVSLVELFEQRILTLKEIILLCEIDSLSKKDPGCFASNQFLGMKVLLSETHVSKAISKLIKLGWVYVAKCDGRKRYLKTTMNERSRQTCRKGQGRPVEKVNIVLSDKNKKTLSEVGTSDHDVETSDFSTKTNITEWDYKAADQLHKVISSVVKVNKRMDRKKWANTIRVMRTRDKLSKRDIGEMIKWYADHIGGEFDVEAYSADSFRAKWEKLTAAKMRKKTNGTNAPRCGTPAHKRKMKVAEDVLRWLEQNGRIEKGDRLFSQWDLNQALAAIGQKKDAVSLQFIITEGKEE